MRVILFDDETMEPITILHLEPWAAERVRRHGTSLPLRFPVIQRLDFPSLHKREVLPPLDSIKDWVVTIWFEKFARNNVTHIFAFTRDSELALQLKSAFLPGQQKEVHAAFNRSLMTALQR